MTRGSLWAGHVACGRQHDVIRGVGYDDVGMAHANVIVDQVNVDPVNGRRSQGGPLVSQRVSPTGGTRVSVLCKKKKEKGIASSGRKSSWALLVLGLAGPVPAHFSFSSFSFFFSSRCG